MFTKMSVRENLEMGGYLLDGNQIDNAIDQIFSQIPFLEEKKDQNAGSLSGGQQQLLEIAMGLILDPDILLLDEPSAGLAPQLQSDVFRRVEGFRDNGLSILMIEQNAKAALEISNRGYVLDDGRVELEDNADSLLHNDRIRELYLGT